MSERLGGEPSRLVPGAFFLWTFDSASLANRLEDTQGDLHPSVWCVTSAFRRTGAFNGRVGAAGINDGGNDSTHKSHTVNVSLMRTELYLIVVSRREVALYDLMC